MGNSIKTLSDHLVLLQHVPVVSERLSDGHCPRGPVNTKVLVGHCVSVADLICQLCIWGLLGTIFMYCISLLYTCLW